MLHSLEALLAPWVRDDAPGLIVSVQQHGRTLLRRGCGLAHLDAGVMNSPATKMRIGSTTKHFVCVLLLGLRDEGRLSLDEPVCRWLPELPARQGFRTLRQLMTHTGGTRDFLDLSLLSNGMAMLPDEAAYEYQCRQEEDNFESGTAFAYNNGGYRMLSMVVERELGRPLAQVLRERLFDPLDMTDTQLWTSDLLPLPGAAQTHLAQPDGTFIKGFFPCTTLGEGGIACTLDDMQRWMGHLAAHRFLDELTRPTTLANGHVNAYGLGLISETFRGVRLIHHAGGMVGGNSQMLIAPEHGVQIAVMCNRSDVSAPDLAQRLLVQLLENGMTAPPVPAAQAPQGHYFSAERSRYYSIERSGSILVLRHFGSPLPLVKGNEGDSLRVDHPVLALALSTIPGQDSIDVFEQGQVYRCERFQPIDDCSAFTGCWHSADLAASVVIEGQVMTVAGRHGRSRFELQALRADFCLLRSQELAVPFGATLRVLKAPDGHRQLTLETARTARLRFVEAA